MTSAAWTPWERPSRRPNEGRPGTRSRALPVPSSGPCSASPALPLLSIQSLQPTQPTCHICSPHDHVPHPRSSDFREIEGQRLSPPGPLPVPGPSASPRTPQPRRQRPPQDALKMTSSKSPSSLPHRRIKRRGLPASMPCQVTRNLLYIFQTE